MRRTLIALLCMGSPAVAWPSSRPLLRLARMRTAGFFLGRTLGLGRRLEAEAEELIAKTVAHGYGCVLFNGMWFYKLESVTKHQ